MDNPKNQNGIKSNVAVSTRGTSRDIGTSKVVMLFELIIVSYHKLNACRKILENITIR